MKKIWKKNKRTILAGLGIVLLAVLLRFCKLSSLPVFADEAIYVRWAQVMRENSAFREARKAELKKERRKAKQAQDESKPPESSESA